MQLRQTLKELFAEALEAALAVSENYGLTSFDADFLSYPLPHFEKLNP